MTIMAIAILWDSINLIFRKKINNVRTVKAIFIKIHLIFHGLKSNQRTGNRIIGLYQTIHLLLLNS